MNNFFSILIPVYNGEKYINECFDTIVNQTFQNFEAIIIDDGSTDNCLKICNEYADKYPGKFKVYYKENGGLISARRAAIERATGEYSIFLDSDDKLEVNCLEVLYETINKSKADMVIYSYTYFDNNGVTKPAKRIFENGTFFDNKKQLYELLYSDSVLNSLWTKAIKTKILQSDPTDYSVYYKYNMSEDLLQSLYPITYSKRIVYIDASLYYYRYNNTSISRNYSYDTIKKQSTLHVYNLIKNYIKIWGLGSDAINHLDAKQFNETMYWLFQCYCNASDSKNKKMILKYPWNEMLPENFEVDINRNPYVSKTYLKLWNMINKKHWTRAKILIFKNQLYNKWKKCRKA